MVLTNKKFEVMINEVGATENRINDVLIPDKQPELFRKENLVNRPRYSVPNGDYLDNLAKTTGIERGVVSEVLHNAFCWGNKGQDYLPVSVKVFEGAKGTVLRVRDSGNGFNHHNLISRRREGARIYQGSGFGFDHFNRKGFNVSYECKGNVVNIQVFK